MRLCEAIICDLTIDRWMAEGYHELTLNFPMKCMELGKVNRKVTTITSL